MYGKNEHPVIRQAGPERRLRDADHGRRDSCRARHIEMPADLVILMVGHGGRARTPSEVARLVNISQDKDGWFIESHPKLDPVATTTDGVYIAGACQAPKDIPDSVAQARAAAARILAQDRQGQARDRRRSSPRWTRTAAPGAAMCNELCPYSAIEFDAEKRRSHVISALCKACGACVAACPSAAIKAQALHRRADLRRRSRGCWDELRTEDRRLPLQLVLLHRAPTWPARAASTTRRTCASSA